MVYNVVRYVLNALTSWITVADIMACVCFAAIQAWRDMGNDYGRIQLVKQYFMCVSGMHQYSSLLRPFPTIKLMIQTWNGSLDQQTSHCLIPSL